jgi:hypothetical protein
MPGVVSLNYAYYRISVAGFLIYSKNNLME